MHVLVLFASAPGPSLWFSVYKQVCEARTFSRPFPRRVAAMKYFPWGPDEWQAQHTVAAGTAVASQRRQEEVQPDVDMELAVARTNANINAGRVILSSPGEQSVVQGGTRQRWGRFTAGNVRRPGLCLHMPFSYGHPMLNGRRCVPERVVWSRPIEIGSGPGYSPEEKRIRTHNLWALQNEGACSPSAQWEGISAPPNDSKSFYSSLRGAGGIAALNTFSKPISRTRLELFGRIGILACSHTHASSSRCSWENYGNDWEDEDNGLFGNMLTNAEVEACGKDKRSLSLCSSSTSSTSSFDSSSSTVLAASYTQSNLPSPPSSPSFLPHRSSTNFLRSMQAAASEFECNFKS